MFNPTSSIHGLANDLLFYYSEGSLTGRKDPPAYVDEMLEALMSFFKMDEMDLETYDQSLELITDYGEASTTWGFILGIQFAKELDNELAKIIYPKEQSEEI